MNPELPPCQHNPLLAQKGDWNDSYCRFCWKWINFPEWREKAQLEISKNQQMVNDRLRQKNYEVGVPITWPQPNVVVQEPSLLQKGVNIAKAAYDHAMAGFPTVSLGEFNHRYSLCTVCENFTATSDNTGSCKLCGCSMHIKAHWKEQKCPVGKW